MGHWIVHTYQTRIVDTGRQPLFLALAGLIGAFLFIRFSVRMIRRQVKWWPGNVQPGGTHIHHVVFGQVLMLAGGIGAFADRGGPVTYNVLAVVFGIGCGLTLDEFALVLHLEDVYWSEQGRRSVDAVILAASVIGLLLIGAAPLGVGGRSYGSYVLAALVLGFVVLCLFKGKVWTGLLGVMVPLLAVVGAMRLARPASPWARWRYAARPRRMARAERRETHLHRRMVVAKTAVMDAVAGAPTPVSLDKKPDKKPAPGPTVVDLPPSRLEVLLARVLPPLRDPGAAAAVWYLRIVTAADLVTGVVAPFRSRVRAAADGEYVTAFLFSPGFTGAALAFVLSVSLRRRKRAAWITTTVLTAAYVVTILIAVAAVSQARTHPVNWVSLAVTVLLLIALLVSRPLFNVRGERGNVALGLTSLVIGAAVAVGVGTWLVYATDRDPPAQWGSSAQYAVVRVLTVTGLFHLPGISVPGWTDLTINIISVALMLVVLLSFFRAPRGRDRLLPSDERRLRALLRAPGRADSPDSPDSPDPLDSLGYFALRRDKAVCWAPEREAAIVYRVVNGVALASGDPLGPAAAWPRVIAHWLAEAHRHAWVPAVAHAGARAADAYEAAGLHGAASASFSAEEPVIEVGPLPDGPARTRRVMTDAGYGVVARRQRDVPEADWARLRQLADAWKRSRRLGGDGVALGRLGDPADPDCVIAECLDGNGRTCALLTFVPWGEHGITLALLRHDRESGPGPVHLVLAELVLRAYAGAEPVAGISRVSLNLPTRAGRGTYDDTCAAYRPRWAVRRLLYERRAELPRVMAAAAVTEGFLPRRSRGAGAGARGGEVAAR